MEEHLDVLLKSLRCAGVSIPTSIFSIGDLEPETLVSICAQSLNLLDPTLSFASSLPDTLVDKFKICTDIALAIKRLGFIGDMTYYKLLYPSEEDMHKLVRFLVERLSELSNGNKIPDSKDVDPVRTINADGKTENSKISNVKKADNSSPLEKFDDLSLHIAEEALSDSEIKDGSFGSTSKDKLNGVANGDSLGADEAESGWDAIGSEKSIDQNPDGALTHNKLPETTDETKRLRNQEQVLMKEVTARISETNKLDEEFEMLKAAAEMAFDDQYPIDFYLEQLNQQIDDRKSNIVELESQWETFGRPLEERKRSLEESLYSNTPEAQEKLQKLREIEVEYHSILSEISRREVEHSNLLADLEQQPKLPSRASYIDRIKEITKNSGKQDADIERILKETRELQLESNSIQERLHRTYAVLDEIVFREAKRDPAGRQAYRHLTSIHECFEQITEKILMMDRVRREVGDYEKKLAAMASRSLSVGKLQADLDAIMKENESLEKQLQE